jgi:hypothetical protein
LGLLESRLVYCADVICVGWPFRQWNFEKFLVDKNGQVVGRWASLTTPETIDAEIAKIIWLKRLFYIQFWFTIIIEVVPLAGPLLKICLGNIALFT